MKESINFNRAATFYDATRRLEDGIAEEITNTLLAEIRAVEAERVLEIGIGTGRMARPLMSAGVQMVGVDISQEMMGQLLAQITPEQTLPALLLGDATALPFRDDAFRAAMIVHVLHLVRSVTETVGEIKRVLAPGGVLLHQTRLPDEATRKAWVDHDEFWVEMCRRHGHDLVQRPTQEEITQAFVDSGASVTVIELSQAVHGSSVDMELDHLRARRHSWMWLIPEAIIEDSMDEFESWMRARSAPDGTFADHVTYVVEAWRWP